MPNTFLSKVMAERQALKEVNRSYPGELQLSGLSLLAIRHWCSKVSLPMDHPYVRTLLELGKLTQTLSNRSNESFELLDPEVEPRMRQLMDDLISTVPTTRN